MAALRKRGADGSAEDIAQEALIRAFEGRAQIDFTRSLWPWLRTVAFNLLTDRARREGRLVHTEPGHLPDAPGAARDLEEPIVVRQAMERLPERQRVAMRMHYLEGRDAAEVGAYLGVNRVAFNRLMFRARQSFEVAYRRIGGAALGLVAAPFGWLRGGRDRIAGRIYRSGAMSEHLVKMASASAPHYVSALAALALVLGGSPTEVPLSAPAQQDPPNTVSSGPDLDHTREDRAKAPRPDRERNSPASVAPVPTRAQAEAARDAGGPQKLVDDITRPNHDVAQPEDAQIISIVPSPRFSRDSTVYAAGITDCQSTLCPNVLFVSRHGGATWKRLEARDFYGVSLLLPPGYGEGDNRIFAMGPTGLQVSQDGGRSFLPAAVAGANQAIGSAAISPAFNDGDPTILIGAQTLMRYRDDLRAIEAVPSTAMPGPLEPAFSPAYQDDGRVLVGGVRFDPTLGETGAGLFGCDGTICTWSSVSADDESPRVRLSPRSYARGRLHAFTSQGIYRSEDDGQTFYELPTPWGGEAALMDLALGAKGEALFAAVRRVDGKAGPDAGLYLSRDGGRSWERIGNRLFSAGALVVRVVDDRAFVALGDHGIACSSDEGSTWSRRCARP